MSARLQIFLLATTVVIIDQLSKRYAAAWLPMVGLNPGISFGMFQSVPGLVWLVVLGSVLTWLWVSWNSAWLAHPSGAGLFFGGSVSNMVDRVFFQGVRDWLPIPFSGLRNNLADWAVVIGLGMVLWLAVTRNSEREAARKPAPIQKDSDANLE